jgi:hypothetical protein
MTAAQLVEFGKKLQGYLPDDPDKFPQTQWDSMITGFKHVLVDAVYLTQENVKQHFKLADPQVRELTEQVPGLTEDKAYAVLRALENSNSKRPRPAAEAHAPTSQVNFWGFGEVDDSLDDAEEWEPLKRIKPLPSARVQLPNPQLFSGDTSKLIPSHYTSLELYAQHLCKVALRGSFTLQEVVQEYFKGHAAKWAETFFSKTIETEHGLPASRALDPANNKIVYVAFLKSFVAHFGAQIRDRRLEALEKIAAGQYVMQPTEKVALYHARFLTLATEAELTPKQQGFYFLKGLPKAMGEKCAADPTGRMLETLEEVFEAARAQERITQSLAHVHDPTPAPVLYVQGGTSRGTRRAGRGTKRAKRGGRGRGGQSRQDTASDNPPQQSQYQAQYQQPAYPTRGGGRGRGRGYAGKNRGGRGTHRDSRGKRGRGRRWFQKGSAHVIEEHENCDEADLPEPPSLNPDLVPTSGPFVEQPMTTQPPPGIHQWHAQNRQPVAYSYLSDGTMVPVYSSR